MLLRFEVSNHRSIMAPVELSMIAVDRDRVATREFDLLDERILTVAGVYGPNASGKSNILDALAWLSGAVRTSLRAWDEGVPRDPFRFGGGPDTPSAYEVELMVHGVRHTYRLEVNDTAVLFEGLYAYPERRRRTLFEREGMDLTLRRGLGGLPGTRELLTPTTLALSAMSRLGEPPSAKAVAEFLRYPASVLRHPAFRRTGLRRRHHDSPGPPTEVLFRTPMEPGDGERAVGNRDNRATALALLRFADVGIEDVQFEEENDRLPRALFVRTIAGEEQQFDLADESEGTRTWFRLLGAVTAVLQQGRPLLLDEIDRSLHPRLSARLIELFKDPETNPHNAQLIFTSHDTSLLNHLNRDEVWLTEKGPDGATTLTALAEYGGDKVRRSLNLERAYLQGRFGALPDLDQAVVRRALGLTADGGADG